MFIIAIFVGALGSILTSIGKSTKSAGCSLFGGMLCLTSAVLFIANIW